MLIVATVALRIESERLVGRWIVCRKQVAMHGPIEKKWRDGSFSFNVSPEDNRQQADFHGRVRRYDERAAIRPCLPLAYPPPGL